MSGFKMAPLAETGPVIGNVVAPSVFYTLPLSGNLGAV
jgi:hypothetical protein